jgi:hypothetical protein
LKAKCASGFKNMAVLALYNPILLRDIDTRVLIVYPFLFEKIAHRKEFATIINPSVGDRNMKLCLDEGEKIDK